MFSNLPLRHQYGVIAAAGLCLVAIVGFGGHFLRQPAPITSTPLPSVPAPAAAEPRAADKEVAAGELVIHVAGAVRNPTVVTMPSGNRVQDAILAAGGPSPEADLTQINLAAKLVDGTQIYVPSQRGARTAQIAPAYRGGEPDSPYAASPSSASKSVNLNAADLAELDTLPGIGPSIAQKILDYRQAHGPFGSVDELLAVPGIGPAKLEQIRPFLIL